MKKLKLIGFLIVLLYIQEGKTVARDLELPKPNTLQLQWQKLETIAFIHFNINTFTDMEWGYGNENPTDFNPTELDCRQWVKVCKDAGLHGIILTAKHHDGFCLWPSAYTEHSVKNSPWKNGKGDVVREFAEACKEYNIKMGLYLSPWDCNHKDYGNPEYNEYYKNQLTELCTNYGDLFEIWFDGANGGRGYYGTDSLHTRNIGPDFYHWSEFADIVHKLQPECIIHGNQSPDIRWVGNEKGYAGRTHWSTMTPGDPFLKEKDSRKKLGIGQENGTKWLPSETDVSVRPGWYYHVAEDQKVKSLSRLMDIYYESVGRNSVLLLNLSPDKRGRIHSIDSLRLSDWRKQLNLDFKEDLIRGNCKFSSDSKRNIRKAFDKDYQSFWKAKGENSNLEIDFKTPVSLNRLLIQEYIPEGQRVKKFRVEYLDKGNWKILAQETTIGYKRILRFQTITTKKLKITFEECLAEPLITKIAVYNAPLIVEETN